MDEAMAGRGVADSLTSIGTSFPETSTTISTSGTGGGSPEVDLRLEASMGERFDDLGQDRRFHDRIAHGTGGGMPGIFQAGQITERTDIGEIDLRGLDEPLADVGEIGPEHDHLVGGFQRRQPGLDRVHSDTEIPRQIGQAEELGGVSIFDSPKKDGTGS